jgi:hypothetical protein
LCERRTKEPEWVDPREALKCKDIKCDGLASLPGEWTSHLAGGVRRSPFTDLTEESEQELTCSKCKKRWTVSTKDLAEQVQKGEDIVKSLERTTGKGAYVRPSTHSLTRPRHFGPSQSHG